VKPTLCLNLLCVGGSYSLWMFSFLLTFCGFLKVQIFDKTFSLLIVAVLQPLSYNITGGRAWQKKYRKNMADFRSWNYR
jgi:hypothetical protein